MLNVKLSDLKKKFTRFILIPFPLLILTFEIRSRVYHFVLSFYDILLILKSGTHLLHKRFHYVNSNQTLCIVSFADQCIGIETSMNLLRVFFFQPHHKLMFKTTLKLASYFSNSLHKNEIVKVQQ